MAETTITINATTNPTYGGYVEFDGADYYRYPLNDSGPVAGKIGGSVDRIFAFFDLSTDPTSGGTITKVELLGTVSSVSGTHAVDVMSGPASAGGAAPGASDADLYGECAFSTSNYGRVLAAQATSAGASVYDLGAGGITDVENSIIGMENYFLGISLSNEAAAGSVVFDAATGFGLKITYTPAASGPTVQATNVLATNVTASTATLSWTRGDGDKVVVFVASAGTGENIAGSLVDTTTYTANTAFGSGTLVSEDGVNWYCVYNGTGTTVNITNLTSGSQYTAVACEYDGTAGAEVYMDDTATGNPVDFSTIAIQMFSSRRRARRRGKKK